MTHEHGPARVHVEDAVLDIGGDIGALILYADESYREREVEISPVGDDARRTHTAIHERIVGGRAVFAGLFPDLKAGTYRLWADDPALPDRVTVIGGEVATVDWRSSRGDRTGSGKPGGG